MEAEHEEGRERLAALKRALGAYREDQGAHFVFRDMALDYVAFERRHMGREERELIPVALDKLHETDWAEIGAAFGGNEDPLFGSVGKNRFRRLFRCIVDLAPPPLGIGRLD